MKRLGGGSFGSVYGFTLQETRSDKNKSRMAEQFEAAFKYIEYNNAIFNPINREIKFFQYVTKIHPLYLLQFYNCSVDPINQRLFLLTEKFDYDLKDEKFTRVFKRWSQQKVIELFLMMATAVKNLHMTGYGHFDLKIENFMIKSGIHDIVKVIDYGMVMQPGLKQGKLGTPTYIAPEIITSKPYYTTRKSDLYSLGITFYILLYGIYDIQMTTKEQLNKPSVANIYFNNVRTTIEDKLNAETIKEVDNEDERDTISRIALRQLIFDLTKIDPNDRIDIVKTVEELERLLKQYDEDSIYLEKNGLKLFNKIYPKYDISKNFSNGVLKPLQPYQPEKKKFSFNFLKPKFSILDTDKDYRVIDVLSGKTFVEYPKEVQMKNNNIAWEQNALMNLKAKKIQTQVPTQIDQEIVIHDHSLTNQRIDI